MNKIIPVEHIEHSIFIIRGQKVMIDTDLALLYGVTAKRLNEAVKRNIERFPSDFMFQLTRDEAEKLPSKLRFEALKQGDSLRSQIATLNGGQILRSQIATLRLKGVWGKHKKYLPYVFTEFGVAMLSSVLRSERAILVNIEIMRTFGRIRQLLVSHVDLANKLLKLEQEYDESFKIVFDIIDRLLNEPKKPEEPPKTPMGFISN